MDSGDFGKEILRVFLAEDVGIDRADVLTFYWGEGLALDFPLMMDREIEKVAARANVEPWAWEALRRLYAKLRDEGEPIERWPAPLRQWVDDFVMGHRREPSKRGPKPDTARAARYLAAVEGLIGLGIVSTREKAIYVLAEASGENEDAIRKILDRAR